MKMSINNTMNRLMAVIIACGFPIAAEASQLQIGLEETINRALATSEELKIKEKEADKTRGTYEQARSSMLPNVSASSSWTDNIEYKAGGEKTDYSMEGGIDASQVLWSFGKVIYAVNSAGKAVEASRLNREAGRLDVIYAAKLSYYSCLLARNTLAITEKSYANALENKELMSKRSYGGRSPKYDIIRMNADVAARVPVVNEARTQYDSAVETLKKLIDAQSDSKVDLLGEFDEEYQELDYEQLTQQMKDSEPTLKSTRKLAEAAEEQVKSQYAGFLPTVSAFGHWGRSGGSNKKTMHLDDLSRNVYAGLRVSVPLWEGGAAQAELTQARAGRDIADLRVKQIDKEYFLELKKAYLKYEQHKSNLAANTEAVNLAEEAFKQAQEMFASGQIDATDLNSAELQWVNQRLNKEATLFSVNATLARIEKLTAKHYEKSQ